MVADLWDCDDDNSDDDMAPEEHNEAASGCRASQLVSGPGRADGRPCGAGRQARRQHRK